MRPAPRHSQKGNRPVKQVYLDTILLIERLHRQFLEVVKAEIDRIGIEDINNVQALILSHVGEEELTVGELTYRGYYLGSNVSYNVKKMVENGYLVQERSAHDRRSVRVRVSGGRVQVGVANIGTRPTVGGKRPLLEVHLFDHEENLYGRRLEVEFCWKLREEEHFESLDALTRAMEDDAARARA